MLTHTPTTLHNARNIDSYSNYYTKKYTLHLLGLANLLRAIYDHFLRLLNNRRRVSGLGSLSPLRGLPTILLRLYYILDTRKALISILVNPFLPS